MTEPDAVVLMLTILDLIGAPATHDHGLQLAQQYLEPQEEIEFGGVYSGNAFLGWRLKFPREVPGC